jgi:all-trans-retinol dehydrogenase (NAD+)
MEAISEELRIFTNGKSSIKFTTVYPAIVLTGMVKKSKLKFPSIMEGIRPQKAASLIIDAQRQNCENKCIPSYWMPVFTILKLLSANAAKCAIDFLDSGALPND